MNDPWLEYATKIQNIAQTGLAYAKDPYDKERYGELREIAVRMIGERCDLPTEKIRDLFAGESGYPTPKVDTRAAIFEDGKILLVHEKNGTWSLPGGWCDADMSVADNAVKEVKEETGLEASVLRLIAVQDWRRHNVCNYLFGVVKVFLLCHVAGGTFKENIETDGIRYFAKDELPDNLATEKCTKEQILLCFSTAENPAWQPPVD